LGLGVDVAQDARRLGQLAQGVGVVVRELDAGAVADLRPGATLGQIEALSSAILRKRRKVICSM